jgi:four helix bundle protein
VFPREEVYGLTSQLRRAAASIGANLAEGCGRRTNSEFARFVRIGLGSASELDYHLLLSCDLGFMKQEDHQRCVKELTSIRKMLTSLLNAVENEVKLKGKGAANS